MSIAVGPSALSPYPALVLLLAFTIGTPAVLVPAILFWAWAPQLFRGKEGIPLRSAVALGVLTAWTPLWFFSGWDYGLEFQGRSFTIGMAVLNAIGLLVVWCLLLRGRRVPSFASSVRFHLALFGWLAWGAFPNLGELP